VKIHKWLGNPNNAINGVAVIEVEPNEVADIDKMAILVDGSCSGHFGYSAKLLSIDNEPSLEYSQRIMGLYARQQFGFPDASTAFSHTRYYEMFVNRD